MAQNINKYSDSELQLFADNGEYQKVLALLPNLSIEDIDYQNNYGNTALYLAANHRHILIAQALLAAGANPNLKNSEGKSAAIAAKLQDAEAIVSLLPAISEEDLIKFNLLGEV